VEHSASGQDGEQRLLLLLAAPALLVVSALVLVPLAWLVGQSFYDDGLSLAHYQRIINEAVYWRSFGLTFRIAALVTIVCLLLGYPVAYAAAMAKRPWNAVILALIVLPFWTSVLVRAYAWLVILQRTGVVNQLLERVGVISEPLALAHNEFGATLATVHILLPFMVLPIYASIQKIPHDLMQAAASLGGGPAYAFRRVFLPLSMPGVISGMTLVFILTLGFYITPELLGGGRVLMVSMVVSRNVELYQQWGAASAVGVVLLLVVAAIFYVVGRTVALDRILGPK
jgi:putative spermidine/putrescine transport system permease protein